MADYTPLTEYNPVTKKGGETWETLPAKLNVIFAALRGFAATLLGKVKNSIEADEDGQAQLVNDLTDAELLPNLVYGTDSDGTRGFKTDLGGRIGTKEVDETGLADAKIPVYDAAAGKYTLQDAPSGGGGEGGAFTDTFSLDDWVAGDGETYTLTITHSLGTRNVLFKLYDLDSGQTVVDAIESFSVDSANAVTLTAATADDRFDGKIVVLSLPSASAAGTFNATTDWGEIGEDGLYSFQFAHGLGTTDLIPEVYDLTSGQVATMVESLEVDSDYITIKVTSDPDIRFAGKVVAMA